VRIRQIRAKQISYRIRKCLIMNLAASLGLEPRQTDPESVVLPLHHEANRPINTGAFVRYGDRIFCVAMICCKG
jgi:hypothetical protein